MPLLWNSISRLDKEIVSTTVIVSSYKVEKKCYLKNCPELRNKKNNALLEQVIHSENIALHAR